MLRSALIRRPPRLPGGRSFHRLLAGLAISSCGDWLYNVALLALVFDRTGSPTLVALTTAARVVPVVVFGPLGGVLADRFDRRVLMIASDLLRAMLMALLALVAVLGLPIFLAPVLAAAATAASVVQAPCVAVCSARLVPPDELARASAARAAIGQASVVLGPVIGSGILLLGSAQLAFVVNAATFLASAAAVFSLAPDEAFRPAARAAAAGAGPSVLDDIRVGAKALREAPVALRLIGADILSSTVYGLLTVTLVLVSRRVGAGTSGYGVLMAAFGGGGIVGAGVTAKLSVSRGWRAVAAVGIVLTALPLTILGTAPSLAAALTLALIGGGGMVVGEVLTETALPQLVTGDVLARAYGLYFPASIAGIVVGSLLAGPLVALFGLTATMLVAGGFVLLTGMVIVGRPEVKQAPPVEAGGRLVHV